MCLSHDSDTLTERQPNFLFSFIFAFASLLIIQISIFFTFIYNLIIFPFTVVHELSHCFALYCFFPGKKAQIEFHLLDNGIIGASVKFEHLPICLGSVISLLIGPFSILILAILCSIILRKYPSSDFKSAGNQFLKFVLLCEIPNLFPIHPPMINAITDGYAASVFLFQMGYIPFVSTELSVFFYSIAAIISFAAFFFLGKTVYFLLYHFKLSILKENQGFQPQFS
ncbi:MAG: hypothetical protein ACFFFH_04300 [Candidatus Thorarchaeota archaeon]